MSLGSTALLLAVLVDPSPVQAQESRAVPTSAPERPATAANHRERAKLLYEQGVEAYESGLYELAISYFSAADRLAPSAALSFNVARAYERLAEPARAAESYRAYLRREPAGQKQAVARARIAELESQLGRAGTVATPAPAVSNGEARGDRVSGELPLKSDDELPILARSDGPSQRERVDRPGIGIWPAMAFGAGGAALITAGVFEWLRRDAEDEVKQEQRNPDSQVELFARMETVESRQTAAQISLGVGAALLLTGGVMLLIDERSTPPATNVGLAVGPGRATASMVTRF